MLAFIFLLVFSGWSDSLETPVDGATNLGVYPDLLWSETAWGGVSDVAGYQVQIAKDSAFSAVVVDDTVEIARYVPCDHPLDCGATYYWRVRCLRNLSVAGSWSEVSSFTVTEFDRYVVELDAADDVDDVRAAFELANDNAPATIRLTDDVSWSSDDTEILYLSGYENVRFDGNGKTITITNPSNRLFHVLSSENLLFENFSVDYDPLPYVLCEVVALDSVANQITLLTISNAANSCLELNDPRMLYASKTHMRLLDKGNPGAVMYGAETYIHDGKQNYVHSYTNNGTVYHVIQLNSDWYITDDFSVGDYMLRVARGSSRNTMRAAYCRNICFNNVTAYASPSQFVSSIDGSGLVVINCNVALKDGRYSSVTADSVYVRRNEIGPWVQDCSFVSNGDDCMNFHSVAAPVTAQVNATTLTVNVLGNFNRFDIGDEVAIWDPAPGTTAPVYTTVVFKDANSLSLTFADNIGTIDLSSAEAVNNSGVFNLTKSNRRFYVKNNLVRNNGRYGVMLASQYGAVVGNTFERCPGGAIQIGCFPSEGLNAADILVQDNRIQDCGYTGTFFERQDAAVILNAYGPTQDEVSLLLHNSIAFVNNRIDGWEAAVFKIKGSSNILVDNNVITDGKMTGFIGAATNDVLLVGNAFNVAIANTTLSDARAYDEWFVDLGDTSDISCAVYKTPVPEEHSGNLLDEGGFENGGASWTLNGAGVVSTSVCSGSAALQIVGNASAKSEYVRVKGNTEYSLCGFICGDALSGGTQGTRMDVRESCTDGGTANRITSIAWQTGTFGYTYFELKLKTLPDTGRLQVFCANAGLTNGTAYFDDLMLIEGDRNLVENGSFDDDLSGWTCSPVCSQDETISCDNSSGSLKFCQDVAIWRDAVQYVTNDIIDGAEYTLSGSIRIPETLGGSGNGLKLVMRFFNGTIFLDSAQSALFKTATEWTDAAFSAVAPTGTDRIQVRVYLNSNTGTVYCDQLKLLRSY